LNVLSALLQRNCGSREKSFCYIHPEIKISFFSFKITLFIFYQQQPVRYILPVSKSMGKVREGKKITCICFSDPLVYSF